MIGKLSIDNQIRKTLKRYRNINDNEHYITATDEGYDAEEAIFNGYVYKIKTLLFNLVNRSQFGSGCDFKHGITEYRGVNCYIPTKRYCFIKCANFLTGTGYNQQNLEFIRNEKRRSEIMTMGRIQPCSKNLGIELGYNNGIEIYPRTICTKDVGLYLYSNHFCLVWKAQGASFNQTRQETKKNKF